MRSVFSRLRSLLRGLLRRDHVEAEMREEMAHHIELRAEALMREGVPRRDAYRAAHREFGHVEGHRESARKARGLSLFDQIRFSWLDVKLGLRMLWKHPALTFVAVFSLAVGIPVGMAPSHLARAIEAPLPDPGGERLRAVRLWNTASTNSESPGAYEYRRWLGELESFSALGAAQSLTSNVAVEGATPIAATGAAVSASTFGILGTAPLVGRTLLPEDEILGAPDVAVIGYELWQSLLDGDPEAVGSTLRVGERVHTIVGVMPEGFHFPMSQEFWTPLRLEAAPQPGEGLRFWVFGTLDDGVNDEEANAEASAVGLRMAADLPDRYTRRRPEVVPFALSVMGVPANGLQAMPEFYVFQGLALLLLIVPCANVAMLVFARTATRSRELAVRTALGAGRLRIVCQVLTEALVLAVLAAGAGLIAVDWLLGVARAYAERQVGAPLPYWLDLGATPRAVVDALGLAALCAVVAGVIPALRVTGRGIQPTIQRATARSAGVRFGGMTSALVVADVAIAVVVVGLTVGLSGRLMDAFRADLVGISAEEYLAVSITLPTTEATTAEGFDVDVFRDRLEAIQLEVVERLEAEPAIRAVGVADALPRMDHRSIPFEIEGAAGVEGAQGGAETAGGVVRRYVRTASVDVDYFDELEHPILAGRGFNGSDVTDDRTAVIVNETFVERLLGGRNPLGRRIRLATAGVGAAAETEAPWLEIVGVVGDLGVNIITADVALYMPAAPGEIHPLRLAVHATGDPEALASRVREIVAEVDPTAVLAAPTALDRAFQGDWYIMVATTLGMALFVGILVTLAASGIYALLSHAVSERTREMGIRVALGAGRARIAALIARRTFVLLGVGALVGAVPGARFLYEIRDDGLTALSGGSATGIAVAAGAGVVALIALAACVGPTLRALRIEPTEALRAE